ncbi:MAG: DNA polymerase/3'-5' exonuclease PolX [Armatimonadetes bacterium]|nr:DNA polymerase/3'-5' exonuclease PolX [Armatimonadota bacterium]
MTNKDVIRALGNVCDLLLLQGADEFRVRSYQRAVNTLRGLSEDLNRVDPATLPGIGKSLAATIAEILTTGSCALQAQLLGEIPAGLVEMLQVPDLGPKTARRLWQELGLETIDAVEQAAREGRLRPLKGFGAKTEENLLANIALWRAGRERVPRIVALMQAEPLLAAVRAADGVQEACLAGSLRRGRDTTKDLDLLVCAEDSGPAIAAFCAHESVAEVQLAGSTKATVRLTSGLNADLRVVPRESWGAAQQYFTGSQAHNVAVRSRARDLGLTVNEYGVRRLDTDEVVAGADEAGVYAALGLPWIPPELREDRGELAGPLPDLLELGDIRGDLHCHTRWSDGMATVAEMAAAARDLGYDYLAITDHSKALTIAKGLDEERLRAQREEIRRVQQEVPEVHLLAGVEVDILSDGSLDLALDALAELDIVVASVHSAMSQGREQMTERLIRAVSSGVVHIVGHPSGRLLGRREGYEYDAEAVIAACLAHGVALELNSAPERLDVDDLTARLAVRRGVALAVNTDAHSTAQLGNMHLGVTQARRGWVGASAVVNTQPGAPRVR